MHSMKQHPISFHSIGRLGRDDEVTKSVLFLDSMDISFVTGANTRRW